MNAHQAVYSSSSSASAACQLAPTPDGWSCVTADEAARVNAALKRVVQLLAPSRIRIARRGEGIAILAEWCHARITAGVMSELAQLAHFRGQAYEAGPVYVVELLGQREPPLAAAPSTSGNVQAVMDRLISADADGYADLLEEARRIANQ